MAQNDFKEQFEAYGGDYEATMARFMQDEDFYLQMLGMLVEGDSLQRLASALQSNDLQAAFAVAHELKGVVGNLGLMPLFQAVDAIVEPLRATEQRDYTPLEDAVRSEFDRARNLRLQLEEGR